jgi:NADH-quinone oxidoreductase subunit E
VRTAVQAPGNRGKDNPMEQAVYEEISAESRPDIEQILAAIRKESKGRPEELIPALQSVQRVLGYLPEEALLEIARLTGLSSAKVFGTVTFYSQFRLQPSGKNIIRVCRGTACHVKGSSRMLHDLEDHLQIFAGQTTADGLFTIETVACFGSCALAPVVVINDSVYGSVNRSRVLKLIESFRAKEHSLQR